LGWLESVLATDRYDVRTATRGAAAEELCRTWCPDVVVTDLQLPDLDGITLLRRLKDAPPAPEIIVITGHATIPLAVQARRAGAFPFVEKPTDPETLLVTVRNAVEHHRLRAENQRLKRQVQTTAPITGIIGHNGRLRALLEMVRSVAPSE